MSHMVRISDRTYERMIREKPAGMSAGKYFELLMENQSRAIEVQRDVSEKLQKILEMLSEKSLTQFEAQSGEKHTEPNEKNASDMFSELFQSERMDRE